MSNAKQIGSAMMMYVQDYDETFPIAYAEANPTYFGTGAKCPRTGATDFRAFVPGPDHSMPIDHCTKFISWLLQPYIKSFQLFGCPSLLQSLVYPNGRGWLRDPSSGIARSNGGSYGWFCVHYRTDVSEFISCMGLLKGIAPGSPQWQALLSDVNVCGCHLAGARNSSNKPILFCNSISAHAGAPEAIILPVLCGGTGRNAGYIIALFADGHAKGLTGDFTQIVQWGLEPS